KEWLVVIISIHLVTLPLQLVDDVQATVHDEGVQVAGFLVEPGHAVAALLRGAEFELEDRLVFGVDDAEVVGHVDMVAAVAAAAIAAAAILHS
ncbi:MAG: hypothetical protein Q9167_001212, partial [Letrouitia subvulpina]